MNKHGDYILLVGAEVPFRERAFAGALRASEGMDVFTVSNTIFSHTLKYFDGYICAPISDHEKVLQEVIRYEELTGRTPRAVIPTNDFTVVTAAFVAKHYGLPHNDLSVVERCRDKFIMRECLQNAGLPVPKYYQVAKLDELRSAVAQTGYPAIIKPRLMAGSLGVIKVSSEEELVRAFEKSIADVKSINGEANADESLFIVEEFIAYEFEVSVEVLNTPDFSRVIGVTDKYLGAPPHFVELGHVVPSRFTSHRDLIELAERTCRTLGIKYGIAHFEAKVSAKGEIKIIEVAARTGGDSIMSLVEKVYGYNPYQLHVLSYINPEMVFASRLDSAKGIAAIAFMKAETGRLTQINVPASLPEEILHLNVMAVQGQQIFPLDSWRNREGIIEFFWPGETQSETLFTRHLEMAKTLSAQTFITESV